MITVLQSALSLQGHVIGLLKHFIRTDPSEMSVVPPVFFGFVLFLFLSVKINIFTFKNKLQTQHFWNHISADAKMTMQ